MVIPDPGLTRDDSQHEHGPVVMHSGGAGRAPLEVPVNRSSRVIGW
jgi:hypothetical protein